MNYHRWHAPVAGTIVRAYLKDGTHFSEAQSEGADDPVIGLMAVIPVGMIEVSSCVIDPEIDPGRYPPAAGSKSTSCAGSVQACDR